MKILLLDDHALFRAGLRLLLGALAPASNVLEAGTIDEALAMVYQYPELQLCLLDLGLRNENGLAALAEIKALIPHAVMVVVSASEESALVRACIDAGAMGYIAKSAPPEVLGEALRQVLAGEVYLPAGIFEGVSDAPSINLPPRQRDVLRGLCRGLSTKAIARDLSLSEHTVKEYIAALFQLLKVHSRTEAVIMAGKLRLRMEEG